MCALFYLGPNNRIPRNVLEEERKEYINMTDLTKIQYWGRLVPDGDVWRARGESNTERLFVIYPYLNHNYFFFQFSILINCHHFF